MSYKPGDSYTVEFATSNPSTGAAANADSTPTVTATFYGTGTGAMALTVTSIGTGRYRADGTIPGTRVAGDQLSVYAAATVANIPGGDVVDRQVLDSKRVGDLGSPMQSGDAVTVATLPNPAPPGYGPAQPPGTTAVTQSTGGTARNPTDMTVRLMGNPIQGGFVEACLASQYGANPATAQVIARTTTDVNGGWTLFLPTGATYTVVARLPGNDAATGTVTV